MQALSPASDELLERRRESDVLAAALDAAGRGEGGVVIAIEGEPGIGKTELLRSFGALAQVRGFGLGLARASVLEADFAFGVVCQLLEPELAALPARTRNRLFAAAAAAAPLFPRFVAAEREGTGDRAPAVIDALYVLVSGLARADRPPALRVDDVHWADAPSLRFLAFLATRIHALPAVLVVAARPASDWIVGELREALLFDPDVRLLRPATTTGQRVDGGRERRGAEALPHRLVGRQLVGQVDVARLAQRVVVERPQAR